MSEDGEGQITPRLFWQVYRVPILLGCLSLLFIVLSITIFIKSYQSTAPISFSSDQQEASGSPTFSSDQESILVDIEGAVVQPGVYRLSGIVRIDDALKAAGGLLADADTDAIARSLNRAAKLTDGAKVYIPSVSERGRASEESLEGANDAGISATENVNINTATQSELESLSGVGPVTAGKVINGRPYTRIEELVEKKAMSQSLFEKLESQLTL